MAARNVADDQAVYAAFSTIFQGPDSEIRKLPSIKRLVRKHKQQPQIAQLLKEYGAPVIYEQLRRLLGCQIFESTLKAKSEFPELFEVSPAQTAERATVEAEATAGHVKAVEEAIASTDCDVPPYESDSDSGKAGADSQAKASIGSSTKHERARLGISVPSLFPLEFQFITGYKILIKTQEFLELACFRFAEKSMPEILAKRKWHCPESAELNQWTHEFSKRLVKFGKKASGAISPSRSLKEFFLSIAQIRHHAVHRIPVTAKELEQSMADGETLVQLFEDQNAIHVMSRARNEVHKAAAEMENKKNMLEARLTKVLQEVAQKRAELDHLEVEAVADTQREDHEYQLFAGAQLQETIWSDDGAIDEEPFATQSPAVNEAGNDCVEDQVEAALESDTTSNEGSKFEDAVKEGPMPSALDEIFISGSDGDNVPAEVEDALIESVGPADADGDGLEIENPGLPPNASEDIDGPEASELGLATSLQDSRDTEY